MKRPDLYSFSVSRVLRVMIIGKKRGGAYGGGSNLMLTILWECSMKNCECGFSSCEELLLSGTVGGSTILVT